MLSGKVKGEPLNIMLFRVVKFTDGFAGSGADGVIKKKDIGAAIHAYADEIMTALKSESPIISQVDLQYYNDEGHALSQFSPHLVNRSDKVYLGRLIYNLSIPSSNMNGSTTIGDMGPTFE